MAINKIENIIIDGENKVFGGFIYNVDYQSSGGETPSTLKLTLVSESGDYFIEPSDLRTTGSPTRIEIGTKIILNMFPISYRFEDSSVGRLLEVEFLDESILFLDKKYVGLNFRQAPNPNVILVGERFIRQDFSGISILLKPSEAFTIKTPEVLYNFPQLLNELRDTFGEQFLELPVLDIDYNHFYKDYTGTLRQVLSAWTNDLGFMFYWETTQDESGEVKGKLNFIDLRGSSGASLGEGETSDVYDVVESKVNSLLTEIGGSVQNQEESYSLRDTFSRGINSTFLKDGEMIAGDSSTTETNDTVTLKVIPTTNIDGFPKGGNVQRMNICHYEIDFLLALMLKNVQDGGSSYKNLYGNDIFTYTRLPSEDPVIASLLANLEGNLKYSVSTYNWFKVLSLDPQRLSLDFQYYKSFSDFIGRFFYYSSNFIPELNFDTNDIVWYQKDILVKNTIINKILEPVSGIISGYDSLTLIGLIGDTASYGYYMREITPEWSPLDNTEIFDIGNMAIIEGNSNSSVIPISNTIIGVHSSSYWKPTITQPTKTTLSVPTKKSRTSSIGSTINSISWFKSAYPDGFDKTNAMNIDVLQNSIPEDLILSFGLESEEEVDKRIFEILDTLGEDVSPALALGLILAKASGSLYYTQPGLSFSKFSALHDLLYKNQVVNQEKPFFSKSFTIPYIDLPITPSVGDGFQSLSISIGGQGIQARYDFGTEQMKLRSSDFYLQNYYDSKTKTVLTLLMPNNVLVNRGNYRL